MLQSLDQYTAMIVGIIAGLATKVGLNYLMVVHFGINGASLATVASLAVMFAIMWIGSPEDLQQVLLESGYLVKLVLVSGIMGMAVLLTSHEIQSLVGPILANDRWMTGMITLVGVIVGVVVFVAGAIAVRLFTIREWLVLPYGKRVMKSVLKGKEH